MSPFPLSHPVLIAQSFKNDKIHLLRYLDREPLLSTGAERKKTLNFGFCYFSAGDSHNRELKKIRFSFDLS